ncbi:hypothetical protein DITRI_Ditri17bG0067600 [Diplodiscus trichospermus]
MAGSLVVVETDRQNTIKEQWQVHFACFITYPSLTSTCPSLVPLRQYRAPLGNWIATSFPSASLQIINDCSSSETILAVCLSGKILEEHYISKLHFSWPQVQCIPEFPVRGSRAVFVSYKDSADKIQKFALRFSTLHEAESFMNALKENLKGEVEIKPLNTDFGSEFSTQSEFTSSNGRCSRACPELSDTTPGNSYTPEMAPSLSYEIEQQSVDDQDAILNCNSEGIFPALPSPELSDMTPGDSYIPEMTPSFSYEIEQQSVDHAILNRNSKGIFPALPPSFTSLLTNCCPTAQKAVSQPKASEEIDLKSQIARYMEDSSFQDMLTKVEKIISEVGADMLF